jgi:CheY-like chemotaxis protein
MHILIIDDHESLNLLLTTFLQDIGYTTRTAANGQEALAVLHQNAELPSMILLDVAMPVMTGWEFLHAVRSDTRLGTIPIAVMTALGQFKDETVSSSVVAYIHKPLDLTMLEQMVQTYCPTRLNTRVVGR